MRTLIDRSRAARAGRRVSGPSVLALAVAVWLVSALRAAPPPSTPGDIQFVFTSDAHYGLVRPHFRGSAGVPADVVNAALVAAINRLPETALPRDGGLRAGENVGALDFVAEGGDIANREEDTDAGPIPSAAESWSAFARDYDAGLTVCDRSGHRAELLVVPGNHDASNAVGYYRPMHPDTDPAAMLAIFNRSMRPVVPATVETYRYAIDKVRYTRDFAGIHFVFLTIWPDSETRAWLETDLARVGDRTPVIVVTHDQPDAEAKHFTNPNGEHDVNPVDRFENLLGDTLADGATIEMEPRLEQAAFEAFLRRHPNVSAYFHGHSNWNQFYDWTGPGHSVALHSFRVDSPMKGAVSALDETRLSFQFVTIDAASRLMTVREILWNADPSHPAGPLLWGGSTTVALSPRLGG
jgi:hypothetical protein